MRISDWSSDVCSSDLIMHALRQMRPWSMVEVFLIGALVAVVKIAGMADVHAEPGLYALGVLTFLLAVINAFDLRLLWDARDRLAECSFVPRPKWGCCHAKPAAWWADTSQHTWRSERSG